MTNELRSQSGAATLDPDKIAATYQQEQPRYEALINEVLFILREQISEQDIKIHAIEHRTKRLDSILEKCARKNSVDPFADFPDIVGIRVICLFRPDMAVIGDILSNSFQIMSIDNKLEQRENPLGYISVHYVCKMKREYVGPRYKKYRISHSRYRCARCVCIVGPQYPTIWITKANGMYPAN
jgi:ppGpp synthetase/RelA/SpoT-type nucleotidyltranferase